MSTVRASTSGGVGFLADWRRVNVAFTRPRSGLIVLGNAETLSRDHETWGRWLEWVSAHGVNIADRVPRGQWLSTVLAPRLKSCRKLPPQRFLTLMAVPPFLPDMQQEWGG